MMGPRGRVVRTRVGGLGIWVGRTLVGTARGCDGDMAGRCLRNMQVCCATNGAAAPALAHLRFQAARPCTHAASPCPIQSQLATA